jgi:hypothetical protein
MIIRQAIFMGAVDARHRDAFDAHVACRVLPLLRVLPGVTEARVLRTLEADTDAPPIHQIYQLHFADRAAMEAMLASERRRDVHDAMAEILPWFDGVILHTVSETT